MRRTTARVMPVNRDGEVLLLFGCDPLRPDLPYWFTIGGAAEPGETLAEAGARRMLEETGIVVSPDELVGPFHRGFHEFSWNGWDIANDSHFFAVRVDDVSVTFDGLEPMEGERGWVPLGGLEPMEVGNVLDSGWWSPDAMPEQLSNADLPRAARLAVEAVGLWPPTTAGSGAVASRAVPRPSSRRSRARRTSTGAWCPTTSPGRSPTRTP